MSLVGSKFGVVLDKTKDHYILHEIEQSLELVPTQYRVKINSLTSNARSSMDSGMIKLPDRKLIYDQIFCKNFATELIEKAKLVEFRVASSQPNIPTYLCAKQPNVLNQTVQEYLAKHKGCLKTKSILSGIQEQKHLEMGIGEQLRENRAITNGVHQCSIQQNRVIRTTKIGLNTIEENEVKASSESVLLFENAKTEVEQMKKLRQELLNIELPSSIRCLNIALERKAGSEYLQGRTMLQLFTEFTENADRLSQE